MKRKLRLTALVLAAFPFAGCLQGGGKYGALAASCPKLTGLADPLSMHFSADARADAKVRAFVAAAKDLVEISAQIEGEAADACRRMAQDLGVPPGQSTPRD